jgi:chaperonin cofactor prefoldin
LRTVDVNGVIEVLKEQIADQAMRIAQLEAALREREKADAAESDA